MGDNARSNHVQIDINHALNQMGIRLYCRSMITILPKGTLPILPLIVFLACSPRNQLHRLRYDLLPFIIPDNKMNMI
jgi:hypothetical protein